jgi:radical SAM superfamily enzyme YgiQ (UPF0313 family)
MVFLPHAEEVEPMPGLKRRFRYCPEVLDELTDLCQGSDLIGIGLSTLHFPRAAQITGHLKKALAAPIIWGGIHPTLNPEECLKHADMVCVGEGENTMMELASRLEKGISFHNIRNLWLLDDTGKLISNPLNPLIQDLDSLPYPDYRTDGHFIMHGNHLEPMAPKLACWHLSDGYTFGNGSAYHIWSTRGCPHQCAFCCNSFYTRLYPGWNRVRRLSTERIISEISTMREKMPFISEVAFMDDNFFSASVDKLENFSLEYKEKVGMPFFCCATPATLDEKKIELMVKAGMRYIWLGIQSGSRRLQTLYKRYDNPVQILKISRLLNRYQSEIHPPVYDLLLDPVFQNHRDQLETVRLLDKMAYPYHLAVYSLTFFPGTDITERARAEGLIAPDHLKQYEKNLVALERTFYRFLLWSYGRNFRKNLLKVFINPVIFRLLGSLFFKPFWWITGRILDLHQRRQMVHWTLSHRLRVMRKTFPGVDIAEVTSPFRKSLSTAHNPIDTLLSLLSRLFRFAKAKSS